MPQKKKVVQRNLSACVEEQFDGFDIVQRIAENERKENYVAVDIAISFEKRPNCKLLFYQLKNKCLS